MDKTKMWSQMTREMKVSCITQCLSDLEFSDGQGNARSMTVCLNISGGTAAPEFTKFTSKRGLQAFN